jgi:hypothetical protein
MVIYEGHDMTRIVLILTSLFCLHVNAAQAQFDCDFDGYEKSERFFSFMEKADHYYDESFGLGHYGTPEIHVRLREEAERLKLDPDRTPIVSADFQTGRLDVSYCAARKCTIQETGYSALERCRSALGTQTCRLYAVRVEERLICTVLPSLKRRS